MIQWLKEIFDAKGYQFFPDRLQVVGVRSEVRTANKFDDRIIILNDTMWRSYQATTDPGKDYLLNPINRKGTAILVPDQYLDAYAVGYHRGKYLALRQVKSVCVYRDNNLDDILDMDHESIDCGKHGINIHKASLFSILVGRWSAGCQVFARKKDFEQFMDLCIASNQDYFTYTLLTTADFVQNVLKAA